MHIIAFDSLNRSKRHVVFGYSPAGLEMTYCGIFFAISRHPHSKQKRCKQCTKNMHEVGKSWRMYERLDKKK